MTDAGRSRRFFRAAPLAGTLKNATALLLTSAVAFMPAAGRGDVMTSRSLNVYGLPGGIETPSAEVMDDGTLAVHLSHSELSRRQGISFQFHPKAIAVLRYGRAEGYDLKRGYLWDRSFDLRFQLFDEDGWRPAVAVGMQDFIGTGVYGAEYIVATKTLTPRLRGTIGLGWGRLAASGDIGSPFGTREPVNVGLGGKLTTEQWFRGPVAPFASLAWQATDKVRLVAEYSGDDYGRDIQEGNKVGNDWDEFSTRLNFGAQYTSDAGYQFGAYVLGGKVVGAQVSLALNPKQAPYPSGLEGAPAPVRPRPSPVSDPVGWSGEWAADPTAQPAIQNALADALQREGLLLEAMSLNANRAELRIRNNRYIAHAQAIGRTARLMTRALPPSVEEFVITTAQNGVPLSSVTIKRSDIEGLENTASALIAQKATITNADASATGLVYTQDLFPRFSWSISPYVTTSTFDPENPLRYEVGAQARARYEISPGIILSGTIRQRVFGNNDQLPPGRPKGVGNTLPPYELDEYEQMTDAQIRAENMGVPRVRTDSRMYTGQNIPTIPELTLNWYHQPTDQIYTRVTAGLLETSFAGVSAEALWYPSGSRLALGAEVAAVRKRECDNPFAMRDYKTTTGHLSAYYDFGRGYTGIVHAGRYLAEDWGATVELQRRFANGWVVGAYATKTDMPEENFGEGSFDKGITISLPLTWAAGTPTREKASTDLRSLARDGGARLDVRGRLYENIRPAQTGDLYESWGRFWR